MKKHRVMIIGPTGCGKTTLANQLFSANLPLRKTQDIIYRDTVIDVPGSYINVPHLRGHLISIAQNHASCILLVVDQSTVKEIYSPGFAKVFTCPVIGVVTKCDLEQENRFICLDQLKRIGVSDPCFCISIYNESSFRDLKDKLKIT